MQRFALFLVLFFPLLLEAQISPEGRKEARKDLVGDLFRSGGDGYAYLGLVHSFEHGSYGIGPEIKAYDSFYGVRWYSLSLYGNYRYLFSDERFKNACGLGAHFSIFGLETDLHFNGSDRLWSLVPKVGYDAGHLSLFYGYNVRLTGENVSAAERHQLMFKMFLYVDAYRYYRMRLRNHYYK